MNEQKLNLLKSKVSAAQLAKFVGSSRQYISSVINASQVPSSELANRLAAACNMYCQRQGYFTISDFIPEANDDHQDLIDQRIAALEIEIAQRIMTIDDLRREADPKAPSMLEAFNTLYRLTTIIEGLRG